MRTMRSLVLGLVATSSLVLTACGGSDAPADKASDKNSEPASTTESKDAKDAKDGAIEITDVMGRKVTFDKQPERVIMGEGRGLFATSILNKDNPVEHVVAIGEDLHKAAPSFEDELKKAVPEVEKLQVIGHMAKGTVTVEDLVALKPDALVMTQDHYEAIQKTGMDKKIDEAGIKYIVTDFRHHPLQNTTVSIEALGKLFGHEDQAEKFNKDWKETVDRVAERTKDLKDDEKPATFLWRAAGLKDCCGTAAKANLGELVDAAGGHNIAEDTIKTDFGDLTAEQVIAANPKYIIATGGAWAPKVEKDKDDATKQNIPHVQLGYTATKDQAKDTLNGLLETKGFDALQAPKEGNLYGVWHQFYDNPLNFIALEQFAKWIHPDLFKDVDVAEHWKKVNDEYMPFKETGVFFIGNGE